MVQDIQREIALLRLDARRRIHRNRPDEAVASQVVDALERRTALIESVLLKFITVDPKLCQEELAEAAEAVYEINLKDGSVVARQDEYGNKFYMVESGGILVATRKAKQGSKHSIGEDEVIDKLGPGDHFGDLSLKSGEPLFSTYTTFGPTKLLVMDHAPFQKLTDLNIQLTISTRELKLNDKPKQSRLPETMQGSGRVSVSKPTAPSQHNAEEPRKFVRNTIDKISVFAPLSERQRELVASVLMEVNFRPGTYICEEGSPGNSFYIVQKGICRVMVTDPLSANQTVEMTKLHQSDFFGEVALIDKGVRTASVIAETDVTCLSLTRRHFDLYLSSVKALMIEHTASKQLMASADAEDVSEFVTAAPRKSRGRRSRPSANRLEEVVTNVLRSKGKEDMWMKPAPFSNAGQGTKGQAGSPQSWLKQLCGMMCYSLESDLYHLLLEALVEGPDKVQGADTIISDLLHKPGMFGWSVGLQQLKTAATSALSRKHASVQPLELLVLSALLSVRPAFKERHCSDWPAYQWSDLCRHMKLMEANSLDKIYTHDAHGTKAYILISGFVRLCDEQLNDKTGERTLTSLQDLFPGDIFGDNVLDAIHTRTHTAIAVTDCQCAVVEYKDFASIRDHGHSIITVDEKYQFVRTVGVLEDLELYRMYRIALLLKHLEISKHKVIIRRGEISPGLFFIWSGSVEVVRQKGRKTKLPPSDHEAHPHGHSHRQGHSHHPSLPMQKSDKRILTTLGPGEYFGESGILSQHKGAKASHSELYTVVAGTVLELLVLHPKHYHVVSKSLLEALKQNFAARATWRHQRAREAIRGQRALKKARRLLKVESERSQALSAHGEPEKAPTGTPPPSAPSYEAAQPVEAIPEVSDHEQDPEMMSLFSGDNSSLDMSLETGSLLSFTSAAGSSLGSPCPGSADSTTFGSMLPSIAKRRKSCKYKAHQCTGPSGSKTLGSLWGEKVTGHMESMARRTAAAQLPAPTKHRRDSSELTLRPCTPIALKLKGSRPEVARQSGRRG
ncbi:unnamed protein product [Chrysoparadoxa australica]